MTQWKWSSIWKGGPQNMLQGLYVSHRVLHSPRSWKTWLGIRTSGLPDLSWISYWKCFNGWVPHLKEERECVVSQLSQQFLLDLGMSQFFSVLHLRVHLPGHKKQVPPEGHTHHIHVLTAVSKRARQHHVHYRHIKRSYEVEITLRKLQYNKSPQHVGAIKNIFIKSQLLSSNPCLGV